MLQEKEWFEMSRTQYKQQMHQCLITIITHHLSIFPFMLPCIVIDFFLNNLPDAPIIQIYSVIKLYMFRTSSLPIIGSKKKI